MIWILKGCCDECPEGPCADCPDDVCKVFDIEVSWPAGNNIISYKDLDVCVKYNNATAGYGCTNGLNPSFITGDDGDKDVQTDGGTEKFRVTTGSDLTKDITIHCHWYRSLGSPSNPDFNLNSANITVKVTGCGTVQTKTVNTYLENNGCSCADSNHERAHIEFDNDGDWTLVKNVIDGGL